MNKLVGKNPEGKLQAPPYFRNQLASNAKLQLNS